MTSYPRGDINQIYERNQEATVYVGNLDTRTDEEILWEIFTQGGPVKNVHIPRDKITGMHSNYGFVEFQLESDADYALKIFNMVKVYGKPMRCNKAAQDKRTLEVGANLFVGNLDPDVDEALLYDTMSAFGNVLSTKVMRDPETGEHRGFGFVAFDAFESSDAALAAMNGQFLCDRPIHVSYAYKKDTKGERHGSAAERLIAGSRQTLLKDQQQQQVMANVMSTMMTSIMPGTQPLGHLSSSVPTGLPTPLDPSGRTGLLLSRVSENDSSLSCSPASSQHGSTGSLLSSMPGQQMPALPTLMIMQPGASNLLYNTRSGLPPGMPLPPPFTLANALPSPMVVTPPNMPRPPTL